MHFLNKLAVAAMFATFVAATPIAEADKRQLGGLPSVVCLTGPLGGLGSIVDSLGLTIVDCGGAVTCTALDIPIAGNLRPIGVSLLVGRKAWADRYPFRTQ